MDRYTSYFRIKKQFWKIPLSLSLKSLKEFLGYPYIIFLYHIYSCMGYFEIYFYQANVNVLLPYFSSSFPKKNIKKRVKARIFLKKLKVHCIIPVLLHLSLKQ